MTYDAALDGLLRSVNICAIDDQRAFVAQKLGSSHRPGNACSDWSVTRTDCEKQPDPRQNATSNTP